MAGESLSISRDAVPRVSWEVRRRRLGDRRWLIRHNDIFEIDPVTDAVWMACADGLAVKEIVVHVARIFALEMPAALEATSHALARFAHLGFVTFED